jgi:hypothetical protein
LNIGSMSFTRQQKRNNSGLPLPGTSVSDKNQRS